MSIADIAALTTATAALVAAIAQWAWLIGPRRNGHRARLPLIEARLALAERALHDCTRRLDHARRHARNQALRQAAATNSPTALILPVLSPAHPEPVEGRAGERRQKEPGDLT